LLVGFHCKFISKILSSPAADIWWDVWICSTCELFDLILLIKLLQSCMIIVLNSIKIRNLKLRLKSYFKSICNIANFELLSFRRSFIWYMTLTYRFTSSLFLWRLQIVNFSQISKTMFLEWWNLGRTRKHWYFLMKLGRLEQFLFFRDTRSTEVEIFESRRDHWLVFVDFNSSCSSLSV